MGQDAASAASYGPAKRLQDGFKLEVRPALITAQIYRTFSSPKSVVLRNRLPRLFSRMSALSKSANEKIYDLRASAYIGRHRLRVSVLG